MRRINRILLLVMLALIPAQMVCAAVQKENIKYTLYLNWKFVWIKAGDASLVTLPTVYEGADAYETTLYTTTSKTADAIFKLRDTITTVITPKIEPKYYFKHCQEGDGRVYEKAWFTTPSAGKYSIHQHKIYNSGKVVTKDTVCTNPVYDMVSMIQKARSYDTASMKKGERIKFLMASGTAVREHELVFNGKEKIKDQSGKSFECSVISIFEPKTEKGKTSVEEILRVYVKNDAARTPLEIDFFMPIGVAKARLN
ncbi:MAG: DUF3108 domain-containing protein [Bacteroidaceae bacterium]|nr:DUF3108 domain-containing protein [Bacteroidaceae bacterium]